MLSALGSYSIYRLFELFPSFPDTARELMIIYMSYNFSLCSVNPLFINLDYASLTVL